MRVIRAGAIGMCFGVRDAIALTETIAKPHEVTIHGELVHNEEVNSRLAARGFASSGEAGRGIPETAAVMITAHGVSNRERDTLEAAGKRVIDSTCPLVRRAHDKAIQLAGDGWHVVVAGKRGHVEVLGLTGDLEEFTVIGSPEEARLLGHQRIAVVCQTTLQPETADEITSALVASNPQSTVRLFNTICRPTRDRQLAMAELLEQCEAVVVVGGHYSNNTRQLVRVAEAAGLPVCRVSNANELDPAWIGQYKIIGLTAGTSTPDDVIDEVERRLEQVRIVSQEAVATQLPPEIPSGMVPSNIWVQWFEWNANHQAELPWTQGPQTTAEEIAIVGRSLQEFQRGESSEGRHFLSRGFRHSLETGDADYYQALTLFIAEENRHGDYLGRFLTAAGVPLLATTNTDTLFRALRRIGGLEGAICMLLTAEVIACTYYRAVHNATRSPLLRSICQQILADEYKHLRFQNERLQIIGKHRHQWIRAGVTALQGFMLASAMLVLWPKHGKTFWAGGYTFGSFWRETFAVFRTEIAANACGKTILRFIPA